MPELDQVALTAVLVRASELAGEELAGIDDAASELAALAAGDVRLMAAAIRRIRGEVEAGGGRAVKQVASLLRRALEIGTWDWEAEVDGRH